MDEYGLTLDNGAEIIITAPKDDIEIYEEMLMHMERSKPWYIGDWADVKAVLSGTERALDHINMQRVVGTF